MHLGMFVCLSEDVCPTRKSKYIAPIGLVFYRSIIPMARSPCRTKDFVWEGHPDMHQW